MALSVSEARQAYQRYRDIRQEIGPINGKDPEAKNAQRSLLLEQATSEHLPSFKEVISTLRESNRIARLQSVETSVITPQPKTPGEKLAEQLLGGYAHFKKRSRTPEATEKFWTQQTGQVFTATRESIGDVFKYLASHEEDSERVKNFKRELTKRLTDRAKKEWETFSPAKLANMLYLYTHSPFAKEMAEQVLTGFFKGPETTIKTTSIGEMPPYPSKPLLLDPQVSGQKVVIKGDQARAFLEYQIAQEKYNLWIRGVMGTEKERFDLRSARIKALQKFAVAALQYLSTDQAAFRTAGRIGTGKTIMLPYNGDFFTDAVYARLLTVDFLDKDELTPTKTLSQIPGKVKALDALKLYTEAATTIEALTAIAKVSGVLYEEEYKIEGYTGAQRVALLRNFELRAKGWSPEQITQAIDVVNNATDFHLAGGNRKEVDEFLRGNPLRTALYRSSNPRIQEIRRLYGKVITPDLAVKDWKQSVFEKAEGIQLSEAMGSTVDGRLINLLYPSDFTGTALEMLQAIERNEHAKEGDEYSNEEPLTVEEVANMGGINAHLGEVEINGATIYYLIRPTAV